MESTEGGEKLFFDAPIEGKLEFVANRVLVAMQGAVRREISNRVAESYSHNKPGLGLLAWI
jgi:hypothetical protein